MVSIPLNSGHRFNPARNGALPLCQVSIPLNSGHRFNSTAQLTERQHPSQSL